MAITGASDAVLVGGEVSSGPAKGDYRVEVTDAKLGESKDKTRKMLLLTLTVKDDPNHSAKNGKKLTTWRQPLPAPGKDDADKLKTMQGILKRSVYEGLGVKWPETAKALDPRIFMNKVAFVRIDDRTGSDGKTRTDVVACAVSADKLPAPRAPEDKAPKKK